MEEKPIIVTGAGGHAKVVISALHLLGKTILGVTDSNHGLTGKQVMGEKIIGPDNFIEDYDKYEVRLANGLGSIGYTIRRREVFELYQEKGYEFESVVHPAAYISENVQLSHGVQVMAGVVIQTGCDIGENSIINTRAMIDHDCHVGSHVHIAPNATICGAVSIGRGSFVGAGAVIIQGVTIGRYSIIGAGAVVVRDVPPRSKVIGVPARSLG